MLVDRAGRRLPERNSALGPASSLASSVMRARHSSSSNWGRFSNLAVTRTLKA